MSVGRVLRRAVMVGAVVASAVTMGTGTAAAATHFTTYQGDDYARYWTYSDNLYACDQEADGHGVYAEYWGSGRSGTISDGNGSKSGCGYLNVGNIDSFRVCEKAAPFGPYCSSRVYV